MSEPTLLNVILTLFLIMDPVGHTSAFLSLTKGIKAKRVKTIVLREMGIALVLMLIFNYLGEYIFTFLELNQEAVHFAAGIVLFLTAIKVLFPGPSNQIHLPEGEPFLVPIAIPWIAGPSLLATIMLYAHMETCQPLMLTAILIAWIAASTFLILAPWTHRLLGKNGLSACERLFAMVLVMIAIQRFMEGLILFIQARP